MRAFFAVDVPPAAALEGAGTTEAPPHLTLLFLGEVPEEQLRAAVPAFAVVIAPVAKFRLRLAGVGAFPDIVRPRVVFAEVAEGAEALGQLHTLLTGIAERSGFRTDPRPFRPHLTLLRVRNAAGARRAQAMLRALAGAELGATEVEEVLLESSVLGAGGAVHRVEARLPLAADGAPPVP